MPDYSGAIICTRGQRRTICDVCDATANHKGVPRAGRSIDLCERCYMWLVMVPEAAREWCAWADKQIERNLGVPATQGEENTRG